jgi:ComF family protein
MLAELLGLVAPPRCSLCAAACGAREALCEACESRLEARRPRHASLRGLDQAWSASEYEGVARDLVVTLKFRGRLRLASRAAEAIVQRAPPELLTGIVVPVPAAPERRRQRGFDPAEAIAVGVAARSGLAVSRCLRRSPGRRQVGRPRSDRLSDPPAVRLRGRAPERAILIDDVVTTGATVGACAEALRDGGASRVVALTFARAG